MPYANTNGVQIYFEESGPPDGEPALFVQGFSVQLITWNPGLLARFHQRGVRTICLDNRDVGLSQKFGGPQDVDGGYSLEDMADDGFAVFDALSIERGHLIGQSMGGMIVQVMANARPSRIKSLSLIYTLPSLDPRFLTGATDGALMTQVQPRLPRVAAIDHVVERERMAGSTEYPFQDTFIRGWAERAYDRCYAPDGLPRQFAAIFRTPQPFADHSRLTMPTAIIHGREDRLLKSEASVELARLIPHSEVRIYSGMGHELVEALWDSYADAICRTIERGRRTG